MTEAETNALRFWNASMFYRRPHDRDRSIAVKVLERLSTTTTGTVQSRAENMLKEIGHVTNCHPPRAS